MTKHDFIKKFAEKANLTQKDAREVNEAFWETIVEAMKDEEGIAPIMGVRFWVTHRDARMGRNPQTGEPITIPAKNIPKVKFSASFKDRFE